jgi:hypothetical protein
MLTLKDIREAFRISYLSMAVRENPAAAMGVVFGAWSRPVAAAITVRDVSAERTTNRVERTVGSV